MESSPPVPILERFYNLAREILEDSSIDENAEKTLIDRWMLSRLQRRIEEATTAMENIQTRRALQSAFYLLFNDLRWYQRRGGKNQLRAVLSAWVRHDVALHAARLRGAVGMRAWAKDTHRWPRGPRPMRLSSTCRLRRPRICWSAP